ncbi:uncharacterized protein BYT42DRAFT_548827 [Radiomyces spectabilis]|uniref:uncharacterized protein n=1 Tax=Radiomyces spectabilis TaxID=64574 RepID=UPI00221FE67C|nr:uncharacterized protein BYT42DRAFT_548827 [Radiomyces spectabilis]KAI8370586.1 hypothetical protein BYT42DRAFT_548827 [Radiomyces spectabilis]
MLTQDTNYIGITIHDQDDAPKPHLSPPHNSIPPPPPPPDYRHSFHGFVNRTRYHQRTKSTHLQSPTTSETQPHSNATTSLSRHASVTLPTINTHHLPNPKPSFSATTSTSLANSPHSPRYQMTPTSLKNTSPHLLPCSNSPMRSTSVAIPEEPAYDVSPAHPSPSEYSGAFRKVRHNSLQPPLYNRYLPRINPLISLTQRLNTTYRACNVGFQYSSTRNPRRVLTKPSKSCGNDGYDNEDFDYILYVNDILGNAEGHKYIILDVLGAGTFGQVVKCRNMKTQEMLAVKVVKNKPAYFQQSMMEVAILKTNQFRGLSTNLVRVFTAQILDALTVLNEARIIHCDLKPENILLKNLETPTIKVIDFGSACEEMRTTYTYIQSRFYRSPEVLLGLPYTSAIDMWSLGCIATELFLGLPLFPGSSEYNQISRIVEMLGEQGKTEQPSKRYFSAKTLSELILSYPMIRKESLTSKEVEKEKQTRLAFIDFLQGLLNLNHFERWSPQQAKQHPFITGEPFIAPFKPPYIPRQEPTMTNLSSPVTNPIPYSDPNHVNIMVHHSAPAQQPPPPMKGYASQPFMSPTFPNLPEFQQSASRPMGTSSSSHAPPNPNLHHQPLGSYTGLPFPRVLDPPEPIREHDTEDRFSSATMKSVNLSPILPSSGSAPHGAGRPRANTVGTMHMSWSPRERPFLRNHAAPVNEHHLSIHSHRKDNLYGNFAYAGHPSSIPSSTQHLHLPTSSTSHTHQETLFPDHSHWGYSDFQGIQVDTAPRDANHVPSSTLQSTALHPSDFMHDNPSLDSDDPQLTLPVSMQDTYTDHGSWNSKSMSRVIDLERDGDWKDDSIPRRSFHRRSNSSVRFSDIALPSSSGARSSVASNVASLHRRVRGHPMPFRQDLEWDGVHSMPVEQLLPTVSIAPTSSASSRSSQLPIDLDDHRRKWKDEKDGWMIA